VNYYRLVRIKRAWVPEWLWWWACNPIPFWNQAMPMYRVSFRWATWLLSTPAPAETEG
jgi:hypothetical protein